MYGWSFREADEGRNPHLVCRSISVLARVTDIRWIHQNSVGAKLTSFARAPASSRSMCLLVARHKKMIEDLHLRHRKQQYLTSEMNVSKYIMNRYATKLHYLIHLERRS